MLEVTDDLYIICDVNPGKNFIRVRRLVRCEADTVAVHTVVEFEERVAWMRGIAVIEEAEEQLYLKDRTNV